MEYARIRLTLAYKGTDFCGWQVQEHDNAPRPRTVQGVLEQAVSSICREPVRIHGAGRTDSGVHALGMVAHMDVPASRADLDWCIALNGNLPNDLSVIAAERVSDDFHCRFAARGKVYAYSLWLSRRYVLPQRADFVWRVGPLDWEALDAAARRMEGEHDFAAFRNLGTDTETTVREIFAITRTPGLDPALGGGGDNEMVLRFHGSGFLKQMVRNCVGCLVAVGLGKLPPEVVTDLIQGRDRSAAPATAPASGLTLERVEY